MSRRAPDFPVILASMIVSGLVSLYLGQDGNWDLRNYHFYNAYSFLSGRLTFDVAPAQIQTYWNPLLDVPFYILMTHVRPVLYGFTVGALQGVNIWLVYRVALVEVAQCSVPARHALGLAAAITGYYAAGNLLEIGTTFHDNVASLLVLAAVVVVIRELPLNPRMLSLRGTFVAGLLLGLAAGFKLALAIYAVAFVVSLPVLGSGWRHRLAGVLLASGGASAGFLTVMGPWMVTLWTHFESPLFPFFNKILQSPYFEPVNFSDTRFGPKKLLQRPLFPFFFIRETSLVAENGFRDARFVVCYLLLALFLFVVFSRWIARREGVRQIQDGREFVVVLRPASRFLLLFFVMSYVLWQSLFSIYRYLVPLELIAPVIIVTILTYLFPFPRVSVPLSVATFCFLVLTMSPFPSVRAAWSDRYFDVHVPEVQTLADATIIMADNEPLSYVIPFFPATARFVSVKNNFMTPASGTLLQARARDIISRSSGPLFLLGKGRSRENYEEVLLSYRLQRSMTGVRWIQSRFDDDVYLYPLTRIP